MRQHPVGEGRDTDGDIAERRADRGGHGLGALDAHRRIDVALGEHRPRHVEDDERLCVGAQTPVVRPLEDGLRRRETEKRGAERRALRAAAASARRRGGATPRWSRTRPAFRRARSIATSGTTSPTARSAPSGVRIVSDMSRERARRRRRSASGAKARPCSCRSASSAGDFAPRRTGPVGEPWVPPRQ